VSTQRDDSPAFPVVLPSGVPETTADNGVSPTPDLVRQFNELARQWKQATAFSSSLTEMKEHPAYLQIIGLGKTAVPLILDELRRAPDFWFAALKTLTGEDPVKPADRGQVRRMAQAWLEWGQTHGY
jgi:hypothetical protein